MLEYILGDWMNTIELSELNSFYQNLKSISSRSIHFITNVVLAYSTQRDIFKQMGFLLTQEKKKTKISVVAIQSKDAEMIGTLQH